MMHQMSPTGAPGPPTGRVRERIPPEGRIKADVGQSTAPLRLALKKEEHPVVLARPPTLLLDCSSRMFLHFFPTEHLGKRFPLACCQWRWTWEKWCRQNPPQDANDTSCGAS